MSLLSVVQSFCSRTGLPLPAAVRGTRDKQVSQILALLNEVVEDLLECDWQDLTTEALFVTTAGEDQGSLDTIAPGQLRIKNKTIFNRTLRLPVFGPLGDVKWQALKALPAMGPFYKYRIRGGHLLFNPPAVAGHTCAFEYISKNIVCHHPEDEGDPLTYGPELEYDTDTLILHEGDKLLLAGLRWKWKAEKRLDYSEEKGRYDVLVKQALGYDATKPTIALDSADDTLRPGIWVPSGNWNVP